MTERKDLSDVNRFEIEQDAECWVFELWETGESLAIARECLINAFDREAKRLDKPYD